MNEKQDDQKPKWSIPTRQRAEAGPDKYVTRQVWVGKPWQQALIGAAFMALFVPMVAWFFTGFGGHAWAMTTYFWIALGAFVLWLVAFKLGAIRPYRP